MKLRNRLFALLSALLVLVQLFSVCTFAADEYSQSKNSGKRDEICVSIDGTGISEYYKGEYSINALTSKSGTALLTALRTLMKSTHKYISSYADCRDYADETACENGNDKIVTLYTSYNSSYSEYNNGSGWNREHVWPKSIGGFDNSGAGADMHHIRPTENRTNSQRGNKKYGNVDGGSVTTGNMSGLGGGNYNSQYFEPLDNVKGDVARICLYVYARWGGEYAQSSNILNVFQSVDVLLEWCESDPVDTWEMGRNEVVSAIQGNRNVFIDYPELAWLLFDREVPADMTTPSGLAKGGIAPNECAHENKTLIGEKKADCLDDGYSGDSVCSDCGQTLQKGSVTLASADSHVFDEGTVIIEPTESSVGYKKHVCSVCGEVKMVEIARLGDTEEVGCTAFAATGTVYIALLGIGAVYITRKREG